MRIPTILGLGLLFAAVVLGTAIFVYHQRISKEIMEKYSPFDIEIVNLTDSQATIVWQTETPVVSEIILGNQILSQKGFDDRGSSGLRLTHSVTMKNLTPQTRYQFKIKADKFTYPKTPQSFTTGDKLDKQAQTPIKPVVGTVVNSSLDPIDEALVFFQSEKFATISTYTSTAGSFILPLGNLRTKDLKNSYNPTGQEEATIKIIRGHAQSNIELVVPAVNPHLPPVTIGENRDFKKLVATPSATPQSTAAFNRFDLNKDGVVNTLDVSIVLDNFGNNPRITATDFNKDGTVDKEDIDSIKQALQS